MSLVVGGAGTDPSAIPDEVRHLGGLFGVANGGSTDIIGEWSSLQAGKKRERQSRCDALYDVYIDIAIYIAIYIYMYMHRCTCIYVYMYISIYLSIYQPIYLSIYLSIHLFIYLCIYCIYPSI